jgi:DNA-binding response OmpR family regulator
MMPNLTGVELVQNLRSARMALPVVMVAGTMPTHQLPPLQLAATLLKPFVVAELLEMVQDVLHPTYIPLQRIHPRPHWRNQPAASGLWL